MVQDLTLWPVDIDGDKNHCSSRLGPTCLAPWPSGMLAPWLGVSLSASKSWSLHASCHSRRNGRTEAMDFGDVTVVKPWKEAGGGTADGQTDTGPLQVPKSVTCENGAKLWHVPM